MAKFFNFNDGTRMCVDDMQIRYISPVIDTDIPCRSMYSHEELSDITENKPAGVRRILVNKGDDRVYEEHPIIAYELTVIFRGTTGDKIYLRVDEYERFLKTVIGVEASKDTHEPGDDLGPLPQAIFDFAPEWAEYAAMDADGDIYFYDDEPKLYEDDYVWERGKGKRSSRFYYADISWRRSLTRRAE